MYKQGNKMKKNKVSIINYWHTQYGGIVTAYALQEILKSLDCDVKLVDNMTAKELIMHKKNFTKTFKENHLSVTPNLDNNFDLEKLNTSFEIFITGSDQVFRPKYTLNLSQYILDFVKINSSKIAFSASFGVDKKQFVKENSKETIEHMKQSLKSFDFISVREKSGVEICKDLFDIDAEWIIDPVFILDRAKYDELIENADNKILKQVQNNSIVAYVLDKSKDYKRAYKYLEKKYNKKVVETANSNISVESWLKSIRDCKLFITDSFHGMCFAIIFNKPFICLANESRGRTRFDSICEMLGIENQCIDSILEIMQRDCVFKVDYEKVNKKIEEERQRGLNFLQTALETPVKITQEKIDARIKYLENRVCELENNSNLKSVLKNRLWILWKKIFYSLPISIQEFIRKIRGR